MNAWELVTSREHGTTGRVSTVWHRRQITSDTWLAVRQLDAGSWVYKVFIDRVKIVEDHRKTWQRARAAAEVAYDRHLAAEGTVAS